MYIFIIILIIALIMFYNKKGVPIFLYHQVNKISNVTPELFEKHLKEIKKLKMKTLTMSEYYQGNIEKNSMLLTFDDGYFDNYKYVFPLLKKYNMKATIFLNTLYIKNKRDKEPLIKNNYDANYQAIKDFLNGENKGSDQYMTWEEIKEMYESGLVDFQAHSHKHTAIFTSKKIEGFTQKDRMDFTDIYLYGEKENNYPIFSKRGEYSERGIIIKKEFFKKFKIYFEKELILKKEKEKIELSQKFINENSEFFHEETESEYRLRIEEEFEKNKNNIQKNLNNNVILFCWPWGHRSKKTIEILKNMGVKGFISTKKGSNFLKPNWDMIRRIELREYSVKKFKINLIVARNYILGKIYGWLS